MTEARTITLPSKINVDAGITQYEISVLDCSGLEYLKLCVSMGFYKELGVIA